MQGKKSMHHPMGVAHALFLWQKGKQMHFILGFRLLFAHDPHLPLSILRRKGPIHAGGKRPFPALQERENYDMMIPSAADAAIPDFITTAIWR